MDQNLRVVVPYSLEAWHQAISAIISDGINDKVIDNLVDVIRQLIDGDGCSLIVYPQGSHPHCQYRQRANSGDPKAYITHYLERAYLLDPFYRLAVEDKQHTVEGVFSLNQVAPNGFEDSGLYRNYYQLVNFGDEICLIMPTPDDTSIQISISRQSSSNCFTPEQFDLINQLFSTIRAVLLKWWSSTSEHKKQSLLKSHLEHALSHFGSSLLTDRETQVLQLKLRGYAAKYIAEKLGITLETVKHHRKNIYAKLDIGSQAEMFHLFIDSLAMVTPDSPADPLTNYFKPQLKNA